MDQRSVRRSMRGWLSGAIGFLLITGCLPAPMRVSPTVGGKEGTLKTSLAPNAVGAANRGGVALPTSGAATVPLGAPIISNNGANVLKGSVRVPASIISHNGGNIVSNNGGTIISHNGGNFISHNGGNIISHNGSNVRISQVPLAFTTVRLKDAAGNPVKDSAGQELVTKTDAAGNYAFPVDVKGRNLVIEADVQGQNGKLKSLLPKEGLEAGKGLDVDLTSTLTLAYILDQYVKGDLSTFERLPKDIEAKARTVTEEAIVEKQIELPKTLDDGAIVAKVEEVRTADPKVDQIFEEIKKLLVIAGIVREGDGQLAINVAPGTIGAALRDKDGGLYVFSQSMHNLWKIDAAGILHTIVASGEWGYKEQPTGWLTPGYTSGAVFDDAGNFVLADTYNNRVVRISKTGRVSVIAGTGIAGFTGDGGDAKFAQLNRPSGLAIDPAGNLYVSDTENHRIRKITTDGKIQTEFGDGIPGYSGDGQSGKLARLNRPQGLAMGVNGDLYVADFANSRLRVLSQTGQVCTFRPEAGEVHSPISLAFDGNGLLLCLSHQSSQVYRIGADEIRPILPNSFWVGDTPFFFFFSRVLVPAGEEVLLQSQPGVLVTTTLNGAIGPVMGPIGKDDSPTSSFELAYNLVVDEQENAFVTDMRAKRLLKVDVNGSVHVVAGNGGDWPSGRTEVQATEGIGMVSGIALGSDGAILFATNGLNPSVNRLDATNQVSRIIGSGKVDYANPPIGKPLEVSLANPFSVAQLPDGRVVFAETDDNRLCILSANGNVEYLAPPSTVSNPGLLEIDRNGVLHLWERGKKQLSKLVSSTLVEALGRDVFMNALEGQDLKAFAFDNQNRLHLASERKIVRLDEKFNVIKVAGVGTPVLNGSTRDDGLTMIMDIAFAPDGDLYVLEAQQLKRIPKDQQPLPL